MKQTARKLASQVLATAEESSAELLQSIRPRSWGLPDEEIRKPDEAPREPEWTTLEAMLHQNEFPATAKTTRIQWNMNPRSPRLKKWPRYPRKLRPEELDPKPLGLRDIGKVNRRQLRKLCLDKLGELGPDELASLGPGLGSGLGLDERPSLGTGLRLLELLDRPFGRVLTTNCEADKTDMHWRAVLAIGSRVHTWKNGTCSLCERDSGVLTEHHLQPRQYVATQDMPESERTAALSSTTLLCWPCHSVIHYHITNRDLGAHYNTLEKLKQHPRNADWLAWAKKQTMKSLSRLSDFRWVQRSNPAKNRQIIWALDQIHLNGDFPANADACVEIPYQVAGVVRPRLRRF
ncbi:HNH endonuclease [Colletotrichum plurivorum]|uniref:HNH endonuclease n=1 Tax=Colletotrichum plurivorum TaxID=2175906 RepID=A0A8H6KXJ3_9PEZI|nr:HNH endonuclease [Colletotrichum plurivorum]